MRTLDRHAALAVAVKAARAAGAVMRRNLLAAKKINSTTQHDIKLELDVRCQELIEQTLRRAFPDIALLGEEGVSGDPNAPYRWVVDPIDGTVNFTYGIPHACVSIALQKRTPRPDHSTAHVTVLGVVYDPFCDELWTAVRGHPSRLNGKVIRVSRRRKLGEAIVSMGFAKNTATLRRALPFFNRVIGRVRKMRMMGAAALGVVYVATGRFDAYIEYGIRLWDIAAGGLIVECAGGEFWHRPVGQGGVYEMIANNGLLRAPIVKVGRWPRR